MSLTTLINRFFLFLFDGGNNSNREVIIDVYEDDEEMNHAMVTGHSTRSQFFTKWKSREADFEGYLKVKISEADLYEYMWVELIENGNTIGAITMKLLRDRMSEADQADFDADYPYSFE